MSVRLDGQRGTGPRTLSDVQGARRPAADGLPDHVPMHRQSVGALVLPMARDALEGGQSPPLPPGRSACAQPLSPWRQLAASMAFVTDNNRPQPLWQPPPTACLTASGAISAVPSLLMHPMALHQKACWYGLMVASNELEASLVVQSSSPWEVAVLNRVSPPKVTPTPSLKLNLRFTLPPALVKDKPTWARTGACDA